MLLLAGRFVTLWFWTVSVIGIILIPYLITVPGLLQSQAMYA